MTRSFVFHGIKAVLIWVFISGCAFIPLQAFADGPVMVHDLQTTQTLTVRGNITQRVMAYLDVQNNVVNLTDNPKYENSRTHEGQLLVRPAIGYQLTKYLSVWQGVGWTPSFRPRFRDEKQLWEQILLEREFKHLKLSNRTRLEIRNIENTGGVAYRLRDQVLLNVPIGQSKWSIIAYDEPFVNLNSVNNGPRGGFDQNWFFVGLNRKLNRHINVEAGYLNVYVNNPSTITDRMNHVIMANINIGVN